ncbi:hypothetical protein RJ55_07208 [Drechmeria coniospora]|nr:hypothetical protein RJ55_07208 [Drechmeria coniospora]
MPATPPVQSRTIEVDVDFLPAPATKLIVTQYLEASQDPPYWACIVVGAFLDCQERVIWSTELFAAQLDIQLESDEEETASESDAGEDDDYETSSAQSILPTTRGSKVNRLILFTGSRHWIGRHTFTRHPPSSASIRRGFGIPCIKARFQDTGKPPLTTPPTAGFTPGTLFLEAATTITLTGAQSAAAPSIDFSIMSGGWNPITGRDSSGSRPPLAPYGAPVPSQGQPYIYHTGGPGYNLVMAPPYNGWANATYSMHAVGASAIPGGTYLGQQGMGGYHAQHTFAYQPNGAGNMLPRQPQPWPRIDPEMPAAQMTNSSGGLGCEPGYNYFFPAEHTKAHVFKSSRPPWQLPAYTQIPFMATHIPTNTTFAELMKGFGCTNPVAKKNRVVEIIAGGGGKWYKGMEVGGGDKASLTKTIGEVGWDSTRTGGVCEKPVVCLWFCKE